MINNYRANVNVATVTARQCPPVGAAISRALAAAGVDPVAAFPSTSDANGCSVVSYRGTRIFYKAYLFVTPATWVWLRSASGLSNAAFVGAARIVCDSAIYYTNAAGLISLKLTNDTLPALSTNATGASLCKRNIMAER